MRLNGRADRTAAKMCASRIVAELGIRYYGGIKTLRR